MNPEEKKPEDPEEQPASLFAEVRYSLPELLRDVKIDRSSSMFSMEKLDQETISRLYEQQNANRAKKQSQ
jgi:hypothetical protein